MAAGRVRTVHSRDVVMQDDVANRSGVFRSLRAHGALCATRGECARFDLQGIPLRHPFTPPVVSPPTTRSWNTAMRMQIGTIATLSAAEMSGHGNAHSPW